MTVACGTYYGASKCSSGPTPGARGVMAWYTGAYREEGGTNLGIYNCRAVRGGVSTSIHGVGRADDLGTPLENDWSWNLAELIRLHSAELGVQCLIHRRRIFSNSHCELGWRYYDGLAAHFDHIHLELTPEAAARSLEDTVALWQRVLGDPSPIKGDGHVIPAPTPANPGPIANLEVKRQQDRLNGLGFGPLVADGITGPRTIAATKRLQQAAGITADGKFGPVTWAASDKPPAYPGTGIRPYQERLRDRGWTQTNARGQRVPLIADGVLGPKTTAALTGFQREKGLAADGKPGPMTWTALWTRPL